MPDKPPSGQPDSLAPEFALQRKISVKEAAQLNAISEETFRRNHGHLIRQVSPRRRAVELGDALGVGAGKPA
jgi:hypothetical protein